MLAVFTIMDHVDDTTVMPQEPQTHPYSDAESFLGHALHTLILLPCCVVDVVCSGSPFPHSTYKYCTTIIFKMHMPLSRVY